MYYDSTLRSIWDPAKNQRKRLWSWLSPRSAYANTPAPIPVLHLPVMRAFRVRQREPVARLTATGDHLTAQLRDTKTELKESREDGRQLQAELLALARQDGKVNI